MSVAYPFQATLYLPQPITIGDVDGANGIAFTNFSEPVVIPEFVRKRRVKIEEMSQAGLGLPGNRVYEAYRTNPNHYDTPVMNFGLVSPDNVAKARRWVEPSADEDDNPGYVNFTLGDGVIYLGIVGEDYPKVDNYRYNLRICHSLSIMIHVLGLSTVGSIST